MKRCALCALCAAVWALLGACVGPADVSASGTAAPSAAALTRPRPVCAVRGDLPDPVCTPGATDPRVTQATIATTICRAGWSATVRPPVAVTGRIKRERIKAYGSYAGPRPSSYELDHLVPLELGGAPADVANLWPETPPTPNPKDKIENLAHKIVCSGRMPLVEAQTLIARDWRALATRLVAVHPGPS